MKEFENRLVKRVYIGKTTCEAGDEKITDRLVSIMKQRIEERCGASVVDDNADFSLLLGLNPDIKDQGFSIESCGNESVIIKASDFPGLLYGIGKYLRGSIYSSEGFIPSNWRGQSIPRGELRGIYFANHFFNWYHVASEDELTRYIEDIALWGYNTVLLVFPIINLFSWDDPETAKSFSQIKRVFNIVKELGLNTGWGMVPNQDFKNPKKEFKAEPHPDPLKRKGNQGNNMCPSIHRATEYMMEIAEETVRRLDDMEIDYLVVWPYDEGGCACERCSPWGSNGFLKLSKELACLYRMHFPKLKVIYSTWTFDTPYQGEWEGLSEKLATGNGWVDFILADSHEDFPEYPLVNGVPGNLPLLNFPEISMWGLWPWGGFGANPLPGRFETLWKQVRDIVSGGYPYSEGLYDDINKVIVSQFYWDSGKTAEETLREYISYEYSDQVVEDVLNMIKLIEKSHTLVAEQNCPCIKDAEQAYELAVKVDVALSDYARKSWRWRILYIRALLDRERYIAAHNDEWPWQSGKHWGMVLEGNRMAEEAMRELIEIYHAKLVDDGTYPEHCWIRPPLRFRT